MLKVARHCLHKSTIFLLQNVFQNFLFTPKYSTTFNIFFSNTNVGLCKQTYSINLSLTYHQYFFEKYQHFLTHQHFLSYFPKNFHPNISCCWPTLLFINQHLLMFLQHFYTLTNISYITFFESESTILDKHQQF